MLDSRGIRVDQRPSTNVFTTLSFCQKHDLTVHLIESGGYVNLAELSEVVGLSPKDILTNFVYFGEHYRGSTKVVSTYCLSTGASGFTPLDNTIQLNDEKAVKSITHVGASFAEWVLYAFSLPQRPVAFELVQISPLEGDPDNVHVLHMEMNAGHTVSVDHVWKEFTFADIGYGPAEHFGVLAYGIDLKRAQAQGVSREEISKMEKNEAMKYFYSLRVAPIGYKLSYSQYMNCRATVGPNSVFNLGSLVYLLSTEKGCLNFEPYDGNPKLPYSIKFNAEGNPLDELKIYVSSPQEWFYTLGLARHWEPIYPASDLQSKSK